MLRTLNGRHRDMLRDKLKICILELCKSLCVSLSSNFNDLDMKIFHVTKFVFATCLYVSSEYYLKLIFTIMLSIVSDQRLYRL